LCAKRFATSFLGWRGPVKPILTRGPCTG
jgi:hypothetical protein